MTFEQEQRAALRMLEGIEQGTMGASDSFALLDEAEPVLVHLILTWLRERYGAGHPAAEGVIGRVVEICDKYPSVARKAKEGQSDPVVQWFEDSYSYCDLSSAAFIALVVDKLES